MPLSSPNRARLQATTAVVVTSSLWLWRGGVFSATGAGVAGALALLAWLSPATYAPVQRLLDAGVHLFLTAVTWLVLGLVYLLVFTPLRLVRAISGRDPLTRSFDRSAASYLATPRPPSRFDRQF